MPLLAWYNARARMNRARDGWVAQRSRALRPSDANPTHIDDPHDTSAGSVPGASGLADRPATQEDVVLRLDVARDWRRRWAGPRAGSWMVEHNIRASVREDLTPHCVRRVCGREFGPNMVHVTLDPAQATTSVCVLQK